MSESKSVLSAYEISNARSEYERISDQLTNFRGQLTRNEGFLVDVAEKERKAERLLMLTENSIGFTEERNRATAVLETCKQRRGELEPKSKGLKDTIERLEQQIKRIDTSMLARKQEIADLASQLRGPW